MSWYRQIKTLYTISTNMFFYMIWAILSSLLLGNKVDYRLYFISLASAFLMEYLISKFKSKAVINVIPAFMGILAVYIVSEGINIILNSIFIIFILIMTDMMAEEDINYEAYKDRGKQSLMIMIGVGLLIPLVDIRLSQSILKFYIIFLISIIVVMREARSYSYKLRNKKSLVINIMISLTVLLMSLDSVFTAFTNLLKNIFNLILLLADKIIDLIGAVMNKPLVMIIGILSKIMLKGQDRTNDINLRSANRYKPKVNWENSSAFSEWVKTSFKVFIILIVFYIVYKMVEKYRYKHYKKNDAIVEEREKITRRRDKKENFLKRLIKNIFRPSDLREQILDIYRRFEEKNFERGFFKKHMTAKQLSNVTKAYVEEPDGISLITDIYNEAKFSKHEATDEKVQSIKKEFNKVKKQL